MEKTRSAPLTISLEMAGGLRGLRRLLAPRADSNQPQGEKKRGRRLGDRLKVVGRAVAGLALGCRLAGGEDLSREAR